MAEDIISQRANFARQFIGSSGPTQRAQYRRDIEAAAQRDEERSALEFEQAQRNDPQLMNAVTGRAKENRMFREGIEKANLADRKFGLDERKAISAEELAQKRLGFEEQRLKIAARKEALDLQKASDEAEDTIALDEWEYNVRRDPATPPGSEAYKQKMMEGVLRHRNVKKDYRNAVLEQIGYTDPEAAYSQAANAIAKGATRATVRANGNTSTFESQQDVGELNKEYANVLKLWNDSKLKAADPAVVKYFEDRARALEPKLKELGQVTAAPAQPGTTETPATQPTSTPSSVPATQATTIWRTDSKGNRWEYDANKKPTGKYIPAK